jgi:hypothetical protein
MLDTQCVTDQVVCRREREFHSKNTRVYAHISYWQFNYQQNEMFGFIGYSIFVNVHDQLIFISAWVFFFNWAKICSKDVTRYTL